MIYKKLNITEDIHISQDRYRDALRSHQLTLDTQLYLSLYIFSVLFTIN